MTNDVTSQDYWTEIGELARSITAEARANDYDLHDSCHETIDGHQWVIYTAYNFDVAKHSPNDGAWTDLYGGGDVPENFDAVRAFCAMQQDVMEHSDFGKCLVCDEPVDDCTCEEEDS